MILAVCLEILTACVGLFYIKTNKVGIYTKYFVYILFFIAFTEVIGTYNTIADTSGSNVLKGTVFENNYWIHNAQLIITFTFYVSFFRNLLKNKKQKKIIGVLCVLYVLATVSNLVFSDIYFESISKFTYVTGSVFLFLTILIYYFNLLTSDYILQFKKSLPFYFSVGLLLYHLCVTPLFIYNGYYTRTVSESFVKVYFYTLITMNIIMYTIFIIGFIRCRTKK